MIRIYSIGGWWRIRGGVKGTRERDSNTLGAGRGVHTVTRKYSHFRYFWCAVLCAENSLQLVGGTIASEGRIEACINETWGTICDNRWTTTDANIACRELGFVDRGTYVYILIHINKTCIDCVIL